nr:hypothetical protein [Candidatus Sigynarchaeota archaeon]
MTGSNMAERRLEKLSPIDILRQLGFSSVQDFIDNHISKNSSIWEFEVLAFPEFFTPDERKDIKKAAMKPSSSDIHFKDDVFFAAYELTYRRHYEMEDSWNAMLADPDFPMYELDAIGAHGDDGSMTLEDMEYAMLAIADDEFFTKPVDNTEWAYKGNWIIDWRTRFGHRSDVDIGLRRTITKANWKAVRERITEIAAANAVVDAATRKRLCGDEAREPQRHKFYEEIKAAGIDIEELNGLATQTWLPYILARVGKPVLDRIPGKGPRYVEDLADGFYVLPGTPLALRPDFPKPIVPLPPKTEPAWKQAAKVAAAKKHRRRKRHH